MEKTYTITLGGFTEQEGENVLDAVKRFVEILKTCDLEQMDYKVLDEQTGDNFNVKFAERLVLPIN